MDELFVILGTQAFSGYGKYPNKRMFWNNGEDTPKLLLNSMRLNRFEQLLHHLHIDKLYKLRPIIDDLNNNFVQHEGLEEHISIDESMIPYYMKHYAKQYIKGKPIRFGYKIWALCTNNGFIISFIVYTGKSNIARKFGLGGDVDVQLIEKANISENMGYK